MEMSELDVGKLVYIVNTYNREMYQGRIVSANDNRPASNRRAAVYKVYTDAKDPYYREMTIYGWQYKNTNRCNSYSFYFERFQAQRYIEQLNGKHQRELDRRDHTKIVSRELHIKDIKSKSRAELLEHILGLHLDAIKVNQSQLRQVYEHFDKIDEIIKNENNLFFDVMYAFYGAEQRKEPLVKVNPANIVFHFDTEIAYGKLVEVSVRVCNHERGIPLDINIHKWDKFYSYSPLSI